MLTKSLLDKLSHLNIVDTLACSQIHPQVDDCKLAKAGSIVELISRPLTQTATEISLYFDIVQCKVRSSTIVTYSDAI